MKTIVKTALLLVLTTTLVNANTNPPTKKKINVKESSIIWTGKKILGSHTGTIDFKEGYLEMENGKLVGGTFIVDMTTINVTDLEGDNKGKLEGHLKSKDFFGIEKHPEAKLVITNVGQRGTVYFVEANLSIKETTEPISFKMKVFEDKAITNLKVDRTKYDITYGSGSFFDNLGDNTISDNFELDVTLKF